MVVVVVPFGPDSVTVTVVTVGILSRNNVMNRNHDGTLRTTVIMQYAIYYTKKKSDFLAVSATAHITGNRPYYTFIPRPPDRYGFEFPHAATGA